MKINVILTCLAIFLSGPLFAQDGINWMSMNEALEAQNKKTKKILIDIYTNWCPPCKMMDKHTFGNDDVAKYINENYYAVKFNGEGNDTIKYRGDTYINSDYDSSRKNKRNYQHSFAQALGVHAYPTSVFFDEKANVIAPVPGFIKPREYEVYLKMIVNDDYKRIKNKEDWERYRDEFENTFGEVAL